MRVSAVGFYDSPEQQQIVKTKLVTKYFSAWAKIMLPRSKGGKIAYIDLFAGRGAFEDGKPSTPLWILNHAIKNPKLCAHLVTMFNDKNKDYTEALEQAIFALPNIDKLANRPEVSNIAVGKDIVEILRTTNLIPSLFFIDPWGYKGLTLELIGNAIKDWGCDCIFFFNYNRVNPGLTNPFVIEHMNDLFGEERANQLRSTVKGMSPEERQATIVNELQEAIKEVGGKYVLPFQFQSSHGERTSHYIIFVTKSKRGYQIMKDIMFGMSSDGEEVRSFEFAPGKATQLRLGFDPARPHSIPALKDLLRRECAGQNLTVKEVFERHNIDTPYVMRHFKDALKSLEAEGKITVSEPAYKRPKNTLADRLLVTFPP
jgi:three-Cys-motif partner protein